MPTPVTFECRGFGGKKLTDMKKIHHGDLIITKENQNDFKKLIRVSGYIYVRQGATADFPALQTSGNIYVQEGATADFPALQTSGNIYVRQGATADFPALQTSGYIYVRQGATADFPALQTSGYIYVQEGATLKSKLIKASKNIMKIKNKEYDIVHFDSVMFVVSNVKTSKGIKIYSGFSKITIQEGKVVTTDGFIAQKENFTAHGETLKKAVGDLQFKIVSEKLKNEPITPDTIFTVKYYRLLTGACDFGCRDWMERNGIAFDVVDNQTVEKKPIKATELIPMLEKSNAYGINKIKTLITF